MKVRKGFVSNSSSSSFIIAVPEGMEMTVDNMHKALFNTSDEIFFGPEYDWLGTGPISSREVARRVVHQLEEKGKVSNLAEVVDAPYDYHRMDKYELPKGDPRGMYDWEALNNEEEKLKVKVAENIKRLHPNCDFYEVEFSDNDGSIDTEIEHGDALNSRKNVFRFSHH